MGGRKTQFKMKETLAKEVKEAVLDTIEQKKKKEEKDTTQAQEDGNSEQHKGTVRKL